MSAALRRGLRFDGGIASLYLQVGSRGTSRFLNLDLDGVYNIA